MPNRIPYRFSILPLYPQHIVLAYIPREKVIKEFIKVRPKGFYFHEQNHAPFQTLINWFKDNWSTKEYQKNAKRQKSPKISIKASVLPNQAQDYQNTRDWKSGYDAPMKNEMKPDYGVRPYGRPIKDEA